MSYRLAKSLVTLRDQLNAAFPDRDKTSDGWIGDARHAASKSDHNPNAAGVVTALDVDKDLADKIMVEVIVNALVNARDPRIKYIIWRGRIMSSLVSPWTWRTYTGVNGHFEHAHISVGPAANLYDDPREWNLGDLSAVLVSQPMHPVTRPTLKRGSKGQDVRDLQTELNRRGFNLTVDGDFGPATERAVRAFQNTKALRPDGIVGMNTWRALGI